MNLSKKVKKLFSSVTGIAAIMASGSIMTASAEQSVPVQSMVNVSKLTNWLKEITSSAKTLGYTIAGLAVVILGIVLVTAGNEGLSKGKRFACSLIAGVAIISFGTGIISSLKS